MAPTPFYDHLMSMVQATAQENVHVAQSPASSQHSASRKSQITTLLHLVAGVIVAVAVGRAVFVWVTKPTEPPAVATAVEPARSEERVPGAEPVAAAEPAAPVPPVAAEPGPPAPAADDATQAQTAVAPPEQVARASLDDQPAAAPPAEPSPASAPASAPAGVQAPQEPAAEAEAVPAAHEPAPADEPEPITTASAEPATIAPVAAPEAAPSDTAPAAAADPAPQPRRRAIQTGSIARADAAVEAPVATRTAWIVSDVRMRAGPSNSEAVLGTIGRGRPVEVVSCKAWCEVIFAGQRGWVYKGFIGEVPAAGR